MFATFHSCNSACVQVLSILGDNYLVQNMLCGTLPKKKRGFVLVQVDDELVGFGAAVTTEQTPLHRYSKAGKRKKKTRIFQLTKCQDKPVETINRGR